MGRRSVGNTVINILTKVQDKNWGDVTKPCMSSW